MSRNACEPVRLGFGAQKLLIERGACAAADSAATLCYAGVSA